MKENSIRKIIESSGFDYCMIDMEHGAFGFPDIADLTGWFQATIKGGRLLTAYAFDS